LPHTYIYADANTTLEKSCALVKFPVITSLHNNYTYMLQNIYCVYIYNKYVDNHELQQMH